MSHSALQQLSLLQKQLNRHLETYLTKKQHQLSPLSPLTAEMIKNIALLSHSGKRLRAAYVYFGYLACGGKKDKKILDLAAFVELIHSYFLIHDDIMDESQTRHGLPTLHIKYQNFYTQQNYHGDHQHFGRSLAIIAGDLAETLGYEILTQAKFDPIIKNRLIDQANNIILNTITGQTFDITANFKKKLTKQDILRIYEYKTAKYTVEGPLHLGAIAANKDDKKTLNLFSSYGIPLGTAFQMQDDVLGIFGDEHQTGKPADSDIKENKKTILVFKAFVNATTAQKKVLKQCLGNTNLTKQQLANFRQVIIDTGSLNYVKAQAQKLLQQSLQIINKAKLVAEGKKFLIDIAEYLINRNI